MVPFAILIGLTMPAPAQQLSQGWWVIVAAYPTEPPQRQREDSARVNSAATGCGVRTFNDISGKFLGFEPGYNIFVIGAFASRPKAEKAAISVRECFSDAYVKYGEYLGE
jgi:hypothetical protein